MQQKPRVKLGIPEKVSGRTVTTRGVHLQPFGHHGFWLEKASYWVDLLVSMDISWVVLLSDSDAIRKPRDDFNAAKVLLDAGIIPIIREQKSFPDPFTDFETFKWSVELYADYGLKPFWIIRNEPFDDREWPGKERFKRILKDPDKKEAWEIVMSVWSKGASYIAGENDLGDEYWGYVGFPDGPAYDVNPFEKIKAHGCQWIFDQGRGYYAGHHYGKNRPRDYPYDAVTRYGAQLTEEAYRRMLDDYADERSWWEEPIELINQRRTELQSASVTPIHDDTCWRGWEKIAHWSEETFGYVVPMALTEGGWVPRDRPGTGPDTDIRMPHTTPKMVAKKTVQMYDTPSPFFAQCPWLLADEDMGGSGWPFDAWHGWAYNDTLDRDTGEAYGRLKPIIKVLQRIPAKELQPRAEPSVVDVDSDTRDWEWVQHAYGASYRRGTTALRLSEIHEYEGPASLDVWVVDSDGLPIEGAEFYYYHPGAPAIDGQASTESVTAEWYDRAVLKTTGRDGRISFPVSDAACMPSACQGAIWPKGKGDILEGLGLLADTNNRHLNGMWQLVEEGAPLPPEPTPDQEPQPQPAEPGEPGIKEPDSPVPIDDEAEPWVPEIDDAIRSFITKGLVRLGLEGSTYKLQEIVWMDVEKSNGLHHVFLDVVDDEGKRLAGEKAQVSWSDGEATVTIEEKPGEPWGGNFPMFTTVGAYDVEVQPGGSASDRASGLGMGTPDEPDVKHHTSFGLRFVRQPSGEHKAPAPAPSPRPQPKPRAPEDDEAKPKPPVVPPQPKIDSRIASLLTLDLSGDTCKLEEIVWMDPDESKGLHHIYFEVVDSAGQRLEGETVRVSWADGETPVITEKKPGEPWSGNFQMFAPMGSYSVTVATTEGTSDTVTGLGMGTPEHPKVKYHTSFGIRFRKV